MDYIETLDNYLKENLSPKRYLHSRKVAEMSKRIATISGQSPEKCYFAGLSHDIARELSLDTLEEKVYNWGKFSDEFYKTSCLFHGPVGALILKEDFDIDDYEIQEAVAYHSIGNEIMSDCSKTIYVADYISLDRVHITDSFRNEVLNSTLDEMVFKVIEKTGEYLKSIGLELLPESKRMYSRLKKDLYEEKKGF